MRRGSSTGLAGLARYVYSCQAALLGCSAPAARDAVRCKRECGPSSPCTALTGYVPRCAADAGPTMQLYKDGSLQGKGVNCVPIFKRPDYMTGTIPGDMGFDPLGIGSWDVLNMNFLREAEIKHGRVAMLGFAGIMVEAAGIKAPGVAATFGPSTDIFEIHNAAVAKVPLPRLLHAHTRVGTVFYTCKECRVGNPETRNTSRAGLDRWCMVPAAVILNPTL